MLFQPSNISPSTLSGIGAGTVDVTQGLTVSWQVNGDTPMTAYQITIYQNDTASTQKYTTNKTSLITPFQTHDRNGNPQFFSTKISAANLSSAGVVNGYANGYKIIIKQWWSANDYVEQTSASVFYTLKNPTLTIDSASFPNDISGTITATYSQAQGDPISTVEWVFAAAGSESTPIKKTGTVTTQILSFDVDGLISDMTYSIECNVVTASGVDISTGFVQFTPSYSYGIIATTSQIGALKNDSGIYISWGNVPQAQKYSIYRETIGAGTGYMFKVADTEPGITSIIDYTAPTNQRTVYKVIVSLPNNGKGRLAMANPQVTPRFWDYSVLLADLKSDGVYHVESEYKFGLNVETGAVSNNNAPNLQTNFTRYPNRQPITSLHKSGQLKSYIGTVSNQKVYSDSVSLQNAIYSISTSTLHKFLKTRKGDVIRIETSGPISMQVLDESPLQPLYATIDWIEVGDASMTSIVSTPDDGFWPMS